MVYGSFVALRGWSGHSGQLFLRIHFIGAMLLVLIFVAFVVYNSGGDLSGEIYAVTPRAAAEHALREQYPGFDARGVLTLVGDYRGGGAFSMPGGVNYVTLQVAEGKPIAWISTGQTSYFLWTVHDYKSFPLANAETELALAKRWKERDRYVPIILADIIRHHSGTDAAEEARRLMKPFLANPPRWYEELLGPLPDEPTVPKTP